MTRISKKELPLQLWGFDTLEPSDPNYPDEQLLQDFIDNCEKVIPPFVLTIADESLAFFDHAISNYFQALKNEFNRSEKEHGD
jgi:hypothetical protein